MSNNRRNLQVNQPGVQGNEQVDENGWPVPLTSPLDPLKIVVRNGSRGETRDFKAMATDGQNELSLSEGKGNVSGEKFDDLSIKVKKTVGDSLS